MRIGKTLMIAISLFIMTGASLTMNESVSMGMDPVKKAQATSPGNPNKRLNKPENTLESKIDRYLLDKRFSGSVLIAVGGSILLNKGYRYADYDEKILNAKETVHRIGSITKSLTAISALQLQEKGLLDVLDPVSTYIPDFPNGKNIKIFHLLTNTSGVKGFSEGKSELSHRELIRKIEKKSVSYIPGTEWDYENANYSVAAYIVEKASSMPYNVYVQKYIFEPAHMLHSGFGTVSFERNPFSKGYVNIYNNLIHANHADWTQYFGSGDAYMTTKDMYLLDRALVSGALLSQKSLNQMVTPYKHDYGFGIYKKRNYMYSHGVIGGWDCMNSFNLQDGTFVVLFSNSYNRSVPIKKWNDDIFEMINRI
jgi:teichoic acid D-alanine hydrolase